jgi:hypothetical protein
LVESAHTVSGGVLQLTPTHALVASCAASPASPASPASAGAESLASESAWPLSPSEPSTEVSVEPVSTTSSVSVSACEASTCASAFGVGAVPSSAAVAQPSRESAAVEVAIVQAPAKRRNFARIEPDSITDRAPMEPLFQPNGSADTSFFVGDRAPRAARGRLHIGWP